MNKKLKVCGKRTLYLIIPQIGLIPGPQNLWVCNIAKIQEADLQTNTKQSFTNYHATSSI
jgi:hypothetical protein